MQGYVGIVMPVNRAHHPVLTSDATCKMNSLHWEVHTPSTPCATRMHAPCLESPVTYILHTMAGQKSAEPCNLALLAAGMQAPSPTATGQSFIGHSDIVTGLAWANDHSLISTSAGDAILIWHLKPAALLTPDTDPNLAPVNPHGHVQVAPPNPAGRLADAPAANMTEAFDDFQRGEPGLLQQSLEASASRLEGLTEGRHTADTGSSAAAQPSMTTKALSVTTVVADGFQQSTAEAVLLESQHQLVAGSVVPAEAGEPKAGKPAAAEPHLQVQRVIGFNGDSRGTCAWQADSGLLLYAANQCLIVEQLATREQR